MTESEGTAIWVDAEVKARLDTRRRGDESYTSVIREALDQLEHLTILRRSGR